MESFPMAFSSDADAHSHNPNTRTEGQHHAPTEDQDRLLLLQRARAKLSLTNRAGQQPESQQHPAFPNHPNIAPSNGFFVGQESGFPLTQETYPNSYAENPTDLLKRARERLTYSSCGEAHANGSAGELQQSAAPEPATSEPEVSPLERLRLARARLRSLALGSLPSEPPRRPEEREVEVQQSSDSHVPSQTHVQQTAPDPGPPLEQLQQYGSPEVVHHGDDMDIESNSGSPWREEEQSEAAPVARTSESFDFGIDVRKTFLTEPEILEVPVMHPTKSQQNTDKQPQDKRSRPNNKTDHEKLVPSTEDLDLFIINETSSFMEQLSSLKKPSHRRNAQRASHLQAEGMDFEPDGFEVLEVQLTKQKSNSEHRRAPDQPMSEKEFLFSLSQPPPPAPSEPSPNDASPTNSFTGFTLQHPTLPPHHSPASMMSPPAPVHSPQYPVSSLPSPVPPPVGSLQSVPKPVPPPFVTFSAMPTPVPSPLVTMAIAHSSAARNASAAPTPVPAPVPTPVPPPQLDSANQLGSFLGFSLSSILPSLDGKPSPVPPPVVEKPQKICIKFPTAPSREAAKSNRATPLVSGSSESSPMHSATRPSRSTPTPPSSSSRTSRTSPAPPLVPSKPTKPPPTSSKPPKPTPAPGPASKKPAPKEATPEAAPVDHTFAEAAPRETVHEHPAEAPDSAQDSLFSLIPPPPPVGSVDLDEGVEDLDFSFTRMPPPPLGSDAGLGNFSFMRMPPPYYSAEPYTRFPPPRPHGHPPRPQGPQGPQLRPRGAQWLQGRPPGPGPGQGRVLLPTPGRPSSRPPLLPTPRASFKAGRSRWGDYSPAEEPSKAEEEPRPKPKSHAEKPKTKPKSHGERHGERHGDRHRELKGFKVETPGRPERAHHGHGHGHGLGDRAESDSDSSVGAFDGGMHDAGDFPSDDEMDTGAAADGLNLRIESCVSTWDGGDVPAIRIKEEIIEPESELAMDVADYSGVSVKPDPDGPESFLHSSIDLGIDQGAVVKIEPRSTPPREITEENSYLCTECGMRFNDRFNLEAHLYDHLAEFTGKHPYRCSKCPGRVFKDMKLHRHHHMMGLECDVCGEAFHAAISLAEHRMRVHMAKKGYSCNVCNKKYTTASDLAHHQKKRHSKPKKYKCKKCGKCFNHSDYLSKHMQNHHPDDRSSSSREHHKERDKETPKPSTSSEPLSCSDCKDKFATKDLLDEHIQSNHTETQEKTLSCQVCNQIFTLLEDLEAHEVTHGENPFVCEECDSRFPNKQELKDHSKKHRVMHKCVLCGYITSSSSNLMKHMKNYHKDDIFECKECDKWFPKKDELKVHEETEHKKCHDSKTDTVDASRSNPEEN